MDSYDPCVFVLKPGQFLHVNKGRMYAFRSASSASLDANDCHKDLRNELIENKMITNDSICKILAWDCKSIFEFCIIIKSYCSYLTGSHEWSCSQQG